MLSNLITQLPFFTSIPVLGFLAVLTVALGVFGNGLVAIVLFYFLLTLWSLLVSYRLIIVTGAREEVAALPPPPSDEPGERLDFLAEPSTTEAVQPSAINVPSNLPTAAGYDALFGGEVAEAAADLAHELEEFAHKARALLSTDALQHLMATTPKGSDPKELLATVIKTAKEKYPAEDGWVVLSEPRMRETCLACLAVPVASVVVANAESAVSSSAAQSAPAVVPDGAGSLAEMIAAGNVGAAFALIGHRPMFALADAVADFDALYRSRKGEDTTISDLLKETATPLADEQIKQMISALTSALDGTYNDEAEAVKTAIMKAVKVRG